MARVVGYDELPRTFSYGAARNCYAPVPGIEFRRRFRLPVDELNKWAARAFLNGIYIPSQPRRGIDIMHLWNKQSIVNAPWGLTFESVLPRLPGVPADARRMDFLRRRLAHRSCRFVIAMSDFARVHLLSSLADSRYGPAIAAKVHQVYPYQAPQPEARPITAPTDSEPLRLVFVGGDFFRKGGEALLGLIEDHGDDLNLTATVASRASAPDDATKFLGADHVQRVRARLAASPRIEWHERLPNAQVLERMRESHIGTLPTLRDTFGYSVLEAMASGLPVIGTNVQAGCEIHDHDGCWRIDLPTRPDGYWSGTTNDDYRSAIAVLIDGMLAAVREAREVPSSLESRSVRALEHVHQRYVTERTQHIAQIYASV